MNLKAISVTLLAPMENHTANGGEKLLGNASSIKRRPDGRVYISGQMQRHALFSAMERLNWEDAERGATYVSNGDGVTNDLARDLRADLGGFLHTSEGDYSGRRTAPVTATPAVALEPSETVRDLLIRLKMNPAGKAESKQKQALATNEFSQADMMQMSFFLDVSAMGISKRPEYKGERHVDTLFFKHVSDEERKRRAKLFLESTRFLTDYANQARNATSGEPQQVFIVLDTRLSRKASRYFQTGFDGNSANREREHLIRELEARAAQHFFGDDTADGSGMSVHEAYEAALRVLEDAMLCDPTNGGEVVSFAEAMQGQ